MSTIIRFPRFLKFLSILFPSYIEIKNEAYETREMIIPNSLENLVPQLEPHKTPNPALGSNFIAAVQSKSLASVFRDIFLNTEAENLVQNAGVMSEINKKINELAFEEAELDDLARQLDLNPNIKAEVLVNTLQECYRSIQYDGSLDPIDVEAIANKYTPDNTDPEKYKIYITKFIETIKAFKEVNFALSDAGFDLKSNGKNLNDIFSDRMKNLNEFVRAIQYNGLPQPIMSQYSNKKPTKTPPTPDLKFNAHLKEYPTIHSISPYSLPAKLLKHTQNSLTKQIAS